MNARVVPMAVVIAVISHLAGQAFAQDAKAMNISGNWGDPQSSSVRVKVTQDGNDFSYVETGKFYYGPLAGTPFSARGSGEVIGNSLSLDYTTTWSNNQSVTGHCTGVIRPNLITFTCRDSNNSEFTPTWIRD